MTRRIEATLLSAFVVSLLAPAAAAQECRAERLKLPVRVGDPVELRLPAGTCVSQALQRDLSDLLKVYVGSNTDWHREKTPLAGRYQVHGRVVVFKPRFDFVAGQNYVVRARHELGRAGEASYELTPFTIGAGEPVAPARVTAVYPSGDLLPQNTLRFYIHFSSPMQPHVAFNYIKLVNANGKVDEAAFMRFKQELWSEDRTRLTVLVDPGRIKTGVATALGPALVEGGKYRLTVKEGWPTANGGGRLHGFSKSFSVSKALRTRPTSRNWRFTKPAIGTRKALVIQFDRPFDRALLKKSISVLTPTGRLIGGKARATKTEFGWRFWPNRPWTTDEIQVVVDPDLEDVAGNNFRDLLDHPVGAATAIPNTRTVLKLRPTNP